jgi:hypothetical protein
LAGRRRQGGRVGGPVRVLSPLSPLFSHSLVLVLGTGMRFAVAVSNLVSFLLLFWFHVGKRKMIPPPKSFFLCPVGKRGHADEFTHDFVDDLDEDTSLFVALFFCGPRRFILQRDVVMMRMEDGGEGRNDSFFLVLATRINRSKETVTKLLLSFLLLSSSLFSTPNGTNRENVVQLDVLPLSFSQQLCAFKAS